MVVQCVICISDCDLCDATAFPCAHVFHVGCASEWERYCVASGAKYTCPTCRHVVREYDGECKDSIEDVAVTSANEEPLVRFVRSESSPIDEEEDNHDSRRSFQFNALENHVLFRRFGCGRAVIRPNVFMDSNQLGIPLSGLNPLSRLRAQQLASQVSDSERTYIHAVPSTMEYSAYPLQGSPEWTRMRNEQQQPRHDFIEIKCPHTSFNYAASQDQRPSTLERQRQQQQQQQQEQRTRAATVGELERAAFGENVVQGRRQVKRAKQDHRR